MKPHHVTMYPGEDVEIDFYDVGVDGGSIRITLNKSGALRIRVKKYRTERLRPHGTPTTSK